MPAIKSIRTHNIQSHKDVLIELPETGVVVLSGANSNGKSVIRKVLEDTIAYNISKLKTRKSLVNKETSEGYLEITRYDGASLFVNINIEASRTWVRLTRANGEEVTRYLSDKTIPELVSEFGFHYNSERGISLNICDSDDSILFFRTNHVTNGDILNSALTDNAVQRKYETLLTVQQEAISNRRTFMENLRVANAAKDAIVLYDIEKEERVRDESLKAATILSHFYVPDIKEIPKLERALFVNIPRLRLSKLEIPLAVSVYKPRLKSIDSQWREYQQLQKGVCPVCQRPFCSHLTSTSGM